MLSGFIFVAGIPFQAQFSTPSVAAVTDQVLQQPLAGATVTISPLNKTVTTDAEVFSVSPVSRSAFHTVLL